MIVLCGNLTILYCGRFFHCFYLEERKNCATALAGHRAAILFNRNLKGNIGMKKTSFIIVIIIVVVSAISIHLITSPKVLGNMSKSYSEQITTTSDISFSGEAGDRIKFSFKSDIISGNLDMVLYDSVGNEVYTLDSAKALETFFTLERSDTFTLATKCSNFIGYYKIVVYNMSD